LRDSGSIEQDADVVLFIYRKAADRNYQPEDIPPEEKNIAEIHIAKHRNGPTGKVRLYFEGTRATFQNLETRHGSIPKFSEETGGFAPLATPQFNPRDIPPPPIDPNPSRVVM
jgi:hypothetical protein